MAAPAGGWHRHLRHELWNVFIREGPDVDACFGLGWNDVRPDAGFEHGRHYRRAQHGIVDRLEFCEIPLGRGCALRIHQIFIARGLLRRTDGC